MLSFSIIVLVARNIVVLILREQYQPQGKKNFERIINEGIGLVVREWIGDRVWMVL